MKKEEKMSKSQMIDFISSNMNKMNRIQRDVFLNEITQSQEELISLEDVAKNVYMKKNKDLFKYPDEIKNAKMVQGSLYEIDRLYDNDGIEYKNNLNMIDKIYEKRKVEEATKNSLNFPEKYFNYKNFDEMTQHTPVIATEKPKEELDRKTIEILSEKMANELNNKDLSALYNEYPTIKQKNDVESALSKQAYLTNRTDSSITKEEFDIREKDMLKSGWNNIASLIPGFSYTKQFNDYNVATDEKFLLNYDKSKDYQRYAEKNTNAFRAAGDALVNNYFSQSGFGKGLSSIIDPIIGNVGTKALGDSAKTQFEMNIYSEIQKLIEKIYK